ncbi:hypothetical protein CCACVL1_03824, partial [Corchorus capsularis]
FGFISDTKLAPITVQLSPATSQVGGSASKEPVTSIEKAKFPAVGGSVKRLVRSIRKRMKRRRTYQKRKSIGQFDLWIGEVEFGFGQGSVQPFPRGFREI